MEYIATQKFLRMSPKKIRIVVGMVKKLTPQRAVEVLPHVGKRAAEPLGKVIKTAIANASMAGAKSEDLVFSEIQIGEGPRLRRGRARSRGMYHPIKKRMSHIRVVLQSKPTSAKSKVQRAKKGKK